MSIDDGIDFFSFEADPIIEEMVLDTTPDKRTAIIRTSDRSNFRRCRRRWAWQSHLRSGLTQAETAAPLWFGSGFHYALEDFHGLKQFPTATAAFLGYVKASHRAAKASGKLLQVMPINWPELVDLGVSMLDYYANDWLIARDPLKTFVYDGRPQVEVHVQVKVPFQNEYYSEVVYAATLDRVVEDEHGNLWIVDYKTAKRIQTHFFQNDPQISAYCWLGEQLYGRPIAGFIYQQHLKEVLKPLVPLVTGRLSVAQTLRTTHRHYRRSLINLYGDINKAPSNNIDHLNWLATQEDETKDKFIRRDRIYRNKFQSESEGTKLLLELEDMLNLDLPLYPSPTRDCAHMCAFNTACVNMDDGSDWREELALGFRQKDKDFDSWRKYLVIPG